MEDQMERRGRKKRGQGDVHLARHLYGDHGQEMPLPASNCGAERLGVICVAF
jgi:hypothetical protein